MYKRIINFLYERINITPAIKVFNGKEEVEFKLSVGNIYSVYEHLTLTPTKPVGKDIVKIHIWCFPENVNALNIEVEFSDKATVSRDAEEYTFLYEKDLKCPVNDEQIKDFIEKLFTQYINDIASGKVTSILADDMNADFSEIFVN